MINSDLKVDAIVQARMSSTRLPNKVLLYVNEKTLLENVIERIKHSKFVNRVIIATTTNRNDDVLEDFCVEKNYFYFRGEENDVLARFYYAAKEFRCNNILRVTPDDPFKDPEIIDEVIKIFLNDSLEFCYNNNPPTFPEGLDTELFTFRALEKAFNESTDPFEREHVTQYFYRNPDKFPQRNYCNFMDLSYLRWTIDTKEDFELAKLIYSNVGKDKKVFLMDDILTFINKNKWVLDINKNAKRSAMYNKTSDNE